MFEFLTPVIAIKNFTKICKFFIFHKIEHGLTCIELSSKITFEPIHKVTGLV